MIYVVFILLSAAFIQLKAIIETLKMLQDKFRGIIKNAVTVMNTAVQPVNNWNFNYSAEQGAAIIYPKPNAHATSEAQFVMYTTKFS